MIEAPGNTNGFNTLPEGSIPPVYVPPKMWQDLTADEKIERIREEVLKINYSKSRRLAEFSQQIDQLKEHSHLEGKIFIPLKRYYGDDCCENKCPERADGKFYF